MQKRSCALLFTERKDLNRLMMSFGAYGGEIPFVSKVIIFPFVSVLKEEERE